MSRDAPPARAPRAPLRALRRESRLAAADGAPTRAEVAARSQHGAELSLIRINHVVRGPAFIGQSKAYYSTVGNAKHGAAVRREQLSEVLLDVLLVRFPVLLFDLGNLIF